MIGLIKENMTRFFLHIIIVTIALFLFSCKNDPVQVDELTKIHDYPVSTTYNVEMIYSDSGITRAIINAPLRETYIKDENYVEFKKGIQVDFFDKEQKPESKLTANYAISYNDKDIMEAKDDVVLINENNEQLNTEHLIWDQKEDKIYSEVFVKITTPERVIYGDGFESNQDFSKYKITKVKGIINLKDEISSD